MKRTFMLTIGSAFIALILLIAALVANSIFHVAHLQKQIDTVIEPFNLKMDLVSEIQVAAYTRADRLLRMAIENDPFVRDELFLEFNRAGFLVGSGRQKLLQLGLTQEERKLFDAQGALIDRIVPMQEKVKDFLDRGQVENARNVLVAEGITMQETLINMLDELHKELHVAHDQALKTTRQGYQSSMSTILIWGLFAMVLALGLTWFTLRRLVSNARVIDEQKAKLDDSLIALEVEASHDAMTGLCNRKLFYDRLKQAMLQAKRYNRMVGVLYIDLDNFKTVNALYGHHVGDALLAEVAQRLMRSVRESDTVARAGGDEFLVMLGNLSRGDDCETTVDKIEDALENKANILGAELMISASIGCAVYPENGISEEELIRAAETAMYHIKNGHLKPH